MDMRMISFITDRNDKAKAIAVLNQLEVKVRMKNLFGWHSFIDDLLLASVEDMVRTRFEQSVGLYVYGGMQRALDMCRYCNAKKRRGDYDYLPIEDCYEVSDESQNIREKLEMRDRKISLCKRIAEKFGVDVAKELAEVLFDRSSKLTKKTLDKCRTQEFRELLQAHGREYSR